MTAYVAIIIVNRDNVWFLDSGCSNHICGEKEYIFDLDENLTNNSNMVLVGKGNARLQVNKVIHIKAVIFHLTGLKNNLFGEKQQPSQNLQSSTC